MGRGSPGSSTYLLCFSYTLQPSLSCCVRLAMAAGKLLIVEKLKKMHKGISKGFPRKVTEQLQLNNEKRSMQILSIPYLHGTQPQIISVFY